MRLIGWNKAGTLRVIGEKLILLFHDKAAFIIRCLLRWPVKFHGGWWMRFKQRWIRRQPAWLHRRPSSFTLLAFMCILYAVTLGGAPPNAEGWNAPTINIPLLPGVGGPGEAGADADTAPDAKTAATDTADTTAAADTQKVAEPEKKLVVEHIVQTGETLSDIAKQYNIDVDTIAGVNSLTSVNKLSVGQKLKILTIKGALHVVKQGENLWDIAKSYKVDVDKIVATNNLADPEKLQLKQELVIPGAKQRTTTKSTTSKAIVSASGKLQRAFSWPLRGRVSSTFGMRWGRMHEGIDIAVSTGTPVRAAAAGRVTYAGWLGGYGYLVKVSHSGGVETRYGHNSRILVKVGQSVDVGQILARSGNTGNSTGPHVHFEIRKNGKAVNPSSYLK